MDARLITLLRHNLVRLLDRVQPLLASEVLESTDSEIGLCEGTEVVDPYPKCHYAHAPSSDWTTVILFPRIMQIVNKVSQFVFVGGSLCRDERWVGRPNQYTLRS